MHAISVESEDTKTSSSRQGVISGTLCEKRVKNQEGMMFPSRSTGTVSLALSRFARCNRVTQLVFPLTDSEDAGKTPEGDASGYHPLVLW